MPEESDTKTIKDLLIAIAGATLSCFSHCQAYEIVFGEEDDLIDSFMPKDSFRIYTGNKRWTTFKRALSYCGCVARIGNDGKIHVFVPTTTGTDYDYEYGLESEHPFFAKAHRHRLVLPNRVVVRSQPDDDPQYSGSAQIDGYDDLPDNMKKPHFVKTRLQSNAQATEIAQAMLANAELNAESGSVNALMNCGAELYDYVKVGAFDDEDVFRVGNVGSVSRVYNPKKQTYDLRFSFGDPPVVAHMKELYESIKSLADKEGNSFDKLYAKDAYIEHLTIEQLDAAWIDPEGNIDLDKIGDTIDNLPDGEFYARYRKLHLDAETGLTMEEGRIYYIRFDPESDEASISRGDDAPGDPGTGQYWIDTSGASPVIKRWTGEAWTTIDQDEIDLLNAGILTTHTAKANLSPLGLVLLSESEGVIGDIADGGGYKKITAESVNEAGYIYLSKVVQSADYRTVSDAEKTIWGAKTKVFRQATAPTSGMVTGDIWIATANGDKPYTYSGSDWIESYTEIDGGHITTGIIDCSIVNIKSATSGQRVELTSAGVKVVGGKLTLQDANGAHSALLYVDTGGSLRADTWTLITAGVVPPSDSGELGEYNKRFFQGFVQHMYMGLPLQSTFLAALSPWEGALVYETVGDNNLGLYTDGAWETNG